MKELLIERMRKMKASPVEARRKSRNTSEQDVFVV
jgi:hypothetical protein